VRQVLHQILTILQSDQLPRAMCYGCACTLKSFIQNIFVPMNYSQYTQVDCYELRISPYVSVYDTEIYDRNRIVIRSHVNRRISPYTVVYDRACSTRVSMAVGRFLVKNHKRAMCKTMMKADDPCHNNIYATISTSRRATVFLFLKIWTFIQRIQLSKINYVFHNAFSFKKL